MSIVMAATGLLARKLCTLVAVAWLAALAAILAIPYVTHSPSLGDDLTRNTVRLALACYGTAAALMILLRPADWAARSSRGQLARGFWTLAWLAYLVHVAMAFHHYHHWSHADAVEHTREVSGVGEGIYVSHLFTLFWTADVVFWWVWPDRYAARPVWVGRLLHAVMAFVIFNGTVVYETGTIRWAGLVLFGGLLGLLVWRFRRGMVPGNS